MYAAQINTNDRANGTYRFVRALYADTVLELADKVDGFGAPDVAGWMRRQHTTVEQYLTESPDDTFFCGDNGDFRFDVQVVG